MIINCIFYVLILMENCFNIKGYLNYKTNYFESFSEFIYKKNDKYNKYLNIICCNIRSVNSNFDELTLFIYLLKYGMMLQFIVITLLMDINYFFLL